MAHIFLNINEKNNVRFLILEIILKWNFTENNLKTPNIVNLYFFF